MTNELHELEARLTTLEARLAKAIKRLDDHDKQGLGADEDRDWLVASVQARYSMIRDCQTKILEVIRAPRLKA